MIGLIGSDKLCINLFLVPFFSLPRSWIFFCAYFLFDPFCQYSNFLHFFPFDPFLF